MIPLAENQVRGQNALPTSYRHIKRSALGIRLEPQPSNDPLDPLNWPTLKKVWTLALISFCALIGIAQSSAGSAGILILAKIYHKTPTDLADGTSVGLAGLATGPFLWIALSNYYGRTAVVFWGLLGTLGCVVWSSQMTAADNYIAFMISRWLGCTFSSVPSTLGGGIILDVFFLHQRGKAFALYSACNLFGVVFGATLSGFFAGLVSWQSQFWWVMGALGLCAILVMFFLEDTTYDRRRYAAGFWNDIPKVERRTYFQKRLDTLVFGRRVVACSDIRHGPFDSILIGLQPVTLIAGFSLTITFGWGVANQVLLNFFLQSPVAKGGYGFTPLGSAYFYFVQWLAVMFAESYGLAFNDRMPLWVCRRFGHGIWRAEYRLYPLLFVPFVILPVGLGLFGVVLQHHLSSYILALSVFLIHAAEIATVPAIVNYVSECFVTYSTEVTTVLNFYRLILGLTVSFYINPWVKAVGPAWTFGTMSLIAVFGFATTMLLAWKGPFIRQWSWMPRFKSSDDGEPLYGYPSKEDVSVI